MLVPTAEQITIATISDVTVTSPANTEVLAYNSATSKWENTAAASGIADVVDDTTPQLGGMLDVNGNAIGDGTLELLAFVETGSAVNEITITNAATGNGPTITATGDDTNIDLGLTPKGAGDLLLDGLKWPQADGTATYVLQTDGAGQLSWVSNAGGGGLTDVVDDTTPQLGGQLDVNGNAIGDGTLELLAFVETGSAVNELTITNAATTNGPTLSATGDDTNIDLNITPKGSGNVVLDGLAWPNADGTNTYVLQTDGAGALSWVAPGGGSDTWGANQNSAGYDIEDANGNELLEFVTTASAVNHVKITNAAASGTVNIEAAGDDTHIGLSLSSKGNDPISLNGSLIQTNASIITTSASAISPLRVTPLSTAPTSPTADDIYFDDGTNTLSGYPNWRHYSTSGTPGWYEPGFENPPV